MFRINNLAQQNKLYVAQQPKNNFTYHHYPDNGKLMTLLCDGMAIMSANQVRKRKIVLFLLCLSKSRL